jgi:hypothetical protein
VSVKSRKSRSRRGTSRISARSRRSRQSVRNRDSQAEFLLGDDSYSRRGGSGLRGHRSSRVPQRVEPSFEHIYSDYAGQGQQDEAEGREQKEQTPWESEIPYLDEYDAMDLSRAAGDRRTRGKSVGVSPAPATSNYRLHREAEQPKPHKLDALFQRYG